MEKKVLNPKILGAVSAVVLVAVIALVVLFMNRGDNLTAIVVRLLHSEGEVTLTDDNGNEKSMLEDMNLFTGYVLKTGGDGLVKLGLDETKLVTLNNNSLLGFEKHNKEMKLKLDEGQLYFNVQEKLAEDEKLEVETSTMVVGIRGTSGLINANENAITITDGEVEVYGTNNVTGGKNSITLYGGQTVTIVFDNNKEGADSVIFTIEDAHIEDLPDFALKEILQDEDLAERVANVFNVTVEELLDKAEKTIEDRKKQEPAGEVEVEVGDETTDDDTNNNNQTRRPTTVTQTSTSDGNPPGTTDDSGGQTVDNNDDNNQTDDNNDDNNDDNKDDDDDNKDEEPSTYKVTVTSSATSGGSISSDIAEAKEGDTVTITATPNDGYQFTGWTVVSGGITLADASSATTTFVMGNQEVSIKANFEAIKYTISVSANNASYGRVTASSSKGTIGTKITLSASPEPGYTFKKWTVKSGGVSVSSSVSESGEGSGEFNVGSANVNIVGEFELKNYTISYSLDNPALGEVHFYQSGQEVGSYDASTGVASATGVKGTAFTVRFIPSYFAYLSEDTIDGLTDFEGNEDGETFYYEGTYTVDTYDYSGTIPAAMEETVEGEVWFRESVEGSDSTAFLVYLNGSEPIYIYCNGEYNGQTGYLPGSSSVRFSGGGLSANIAGFQDGIDMQVGTPVSIEMNGKTLYFTRKFIDGEPCYFVNLGTGLVCTSTNNGYETTGDSLYIVAKYLEQGAQLGYSFAISEP